MPKFEDLPYGGNNLTCRNCNETVFFASFNRFRYETGVEFQWGYQCQDCGALALSELDTPETPVLEKRCSCGGHFGGINFYIVASAGTIKQQRI